MGLLPPQGPCSDTCLVALKTGCTDQKLPCPHKWGRAGPLVGGGQPAPSISAMPKVEGKPHVRSPHWQQNLAWCPEQTIWCSFPRTAVRSHHQPGGLKQQVLTVLEARGLKSGYGQGHAASRGAREAFCARSAFRWPSNIS